MIAPPDFSDADADLVADRSERLLGAPPAAQRPSAPFAPRFPKALVAISLLLHGCIVAALLLFDRPSEELQRPVEIPVELVTLAPPPAKSVEEAKASESSAAPPEPAEKRPSQQNSAGASTQHPEPKEVGEAKPAATRSPAAGRKREARRNQQMDAADQLARKAPASPPPQRSGAAAHDPGAPESAATEKREAGLVPAGLTVGKTGPGVPIDLGPPIFRAVATPLPVVGGDEPVNYKVLVFGMLERAKHYPEDAIKRQARGIATIFFSLDGEGQVLSAALLRSSGEPDLDAESIALVARAAPFPAPPPGGQRSFAVDILFGMGW